MRSTATTSGPPVGTAIRPTGPARAASRALLLLVSSVFALFALLPATDAAAACEPMQGTYGDTGIATQHPPVEASISAASAETPQEVDCYAIPVTAGDKLRIRLVRQTGSATLLSKPLLQKVRRPDGTTLCATSRQTEVTCTIDTTGVHEIRVRDSVRLGTGDYTIWTMLLNRMSCTYSGYNKGAEREGVAYGGSRCVSFQGTAGDPVRIHMEPLTATGIRPRVEVVRGDGTTECAPTTVATSTCVLSTTGGYGMLLTDKTGRENGEIGVSTNKTNPARGCRPTPRDGTEFTSTELDELAEMDCYTVSVTRGFSYRLRTTHPLTSGPLVTEMYSPDGTLACGPTIEIETICPMTKSGTASVLVYNAPGATFVNSGYGPHTFSVLRL